MTSLALRWAIWRYGVAISGVAIESSAALIRSASWRAQLPRTTLYGLVSHPPLYPPTTHSASGHRRVSKKADGLPGIIAGSNEDAGQAPHWPDEWHSDDSVIGPRSDTASWTKPGSHRAR